LFAASATARLATNSSDGDGDDDDDDEPDLLDGLLDIRWCGWRARAMMAGNFNII
jgi:hypothetical protein